jgi:hypothetical protein
MGTPLLRSFIADRMEAGVYGSGAIGRNTPFAR